MLENVKQGNHGKHVGGDGLLRNKALARFTYVGREIEFLSKPFKTKQLAEKARAKYPERERKTIGVGVVRIKS